MSLISDKDRVIC